MTATNMCSNFGGKWDSPSWKNQEGGEIFVDGVACSGSHTTHCRPLTSTQPCFHAGFLCVCVCVRVAKDGGRGRRDKYLVCPILTHTLIMGHLRPTSGYTIKTGILKGMHCLHGYVNECIVVYVI